MLLAEHGEGGAAHGNCPPPATRGEYRAQNAHSRQQLGAAHQTRDGFDVHRVPCEHEACCRGTECREPAREQHYQEHRRQAVPQGVHDMQPTWPAAGHGPIDRVAQNGHRTIETRTGRARPVRIVERSERRTDRMRGRIRRDDRPVVLHEAVSGRREIQRDGGDENEQQLASHRMRASSESATAESPRERAASACVR